MANNNERHQRRPTTTNRMEEDFDEAAFYPSTARAPQPPGDPLTRYYRIPGIHVNLPSGGAFMPPGAVDFTPKGDVPVYPMGASDEMLLKSPDALMSGFAIEQLIRSCVPAVKTPSLLAQPDLDVLLLAIRAASSGTQMDISPTCPQCETVGDFSCDLGAILATMKPIPPENAIRLSDDVVAYVRPHNVADSFRVATASFEEMRRLQALEKSDLPDHEKQRKLNESVQRINGLNLEITAGCVIKVVVPEGVVENRQSITDFIANIPGTWVKKIGEKLRATNEMGIDRSVSVTCQNCKHTWKAEVEFNPATFFA